MPVIIDGHNLIPHISGLSLTHLDDEQELIRLLQEYARLSRKQVEVYFDNAQPGQSGMRKYGTLAVHFVRAGLAADEAIRSRLEKLGRAARNWLVVSSDQRVQTYARSMHALVKSSPAFAEEMRTVMRQSSKASGSHQEAGLDENEVAQWLEIFEARKTKKN